MKHVAWIVLALTVLSGAAYANGRDNAHRKDTDTQQSAREPQQSAPEQSVQENNSSRRGPDRNH